MNKEKRFMISGIILLLITLVSLLGTYAWFTWKSTSNTSLTMTIGKLADVIFTSGNNISTSTLAPVFNYTDGEKTTFSINNKDTTGTTIDYDVKLNITSIATELKSTNLKYVLLKNNTIVQEGDFSTISTGSTTIYSDSISSSGTTNFTFYLYIDGNSENNLNMINKSLVGTITVSEGLAKYYMKGYDTSFNAIDYNGNECANLAFPEEGEQCLFEIGPEFLNSNIGAAQISTINVVKSDKVPTGVGNATDISRDQNGSVLLYSKISSEKSELNGFDLYDIYISTKNGKVYLTNGALLFEYMINLKSVDLANMYTDEVTDMSGMFAGCLSLESIDASNFNTSNVTNMSGMFDGEGSILGKAKVKNINVSSFDTSNVTNMSYMFENLRSLTTLDISNFNTSKVTNMSEMFYFLDNLTTIYASNNFNTSAVTNSDAMFSNSDKLVGGNGTKYNSSYIDKTYARIDTSSTPGYFTLKN
jgi:surface protein